MACCWDVTIQSSDERLSDAGSCLEHRESVTWRGCFVLSWHPSEYSHTGYDNVSGIFHFSQESHRCSIYGIVDHTLEERKCPLMPT